MDMPWQRSRLSCLLVCAWLMLPHRALAGAAFISEYVEGTSNNKALEIYNNSGASLDLAGYSIRMYANGAATPTVVINLAGVVAAGDVFVVAQSSAIATILAQADQTDAHGWYNGNDAVELVFNGVRMDVIGQVGFAPLAEWGSGLVSTADNTLRRKPAVCSGDTIATDAFDPGAEWDGFATDTFGGLGAHTNTCVPDACSLSYTAIPAIQGSGTSAAFTGTVTTQGIVVGDYEEPPGAGQLRGFYLQDAAGDGDPATSDGLFVFTGGSAVASLGERVRVTGTAGEFDSQTQVSATQVLHCGTGSVTPVGVTLPRLSAGDLERYEGMLVSLPQTLTVTEHFQLGRFGQVTVSSGGRLAQPTNVASPGAPAAAVQAANDLNRLIIDDGTNLQNPDPIVFGRNGAPLSAANTLRGGDTATGITGVMTWAPAASVAGTTAWRVRPVGALGGAANFQAVHARPAGAPAATGTLRIAGMGLLNFFNTFGNQCTAGVGGTAVACRGASDATEFARQWPKVVAAIVGSGADVVGVTELENDGYGIDSAIRFFVDRLNDATGPATWAFVDADAATGTPNALGTDAIKVGMLYRPARVQPVAQTAVLASVEFVNGGDATARNRPALAQAFDVQGSGARFVAVVNHLRSRGGACETPDAGDGQGNCSAVRAAAAGELADWLATDPTDSDDPGVIVLGDFNAYAMEDPLTLLGEAGYSDLVRAFGGSAGWSFDFDGQWGTLDHALASASLAPQVTGASHWHINADEPLALDYNVEFKSAGQLVSLYAANEFRMGDHDPVLVDLDPDPPADSDADGVPDASDNCILTANAGQQDSNSDGYGNACDGDLNDSVGVVNFTDLALFRAAFGSANANADFDSSGGIVNFADLARFRVLFGKVPGPSAFAP